MKVFALPLGQIDVLSMDNDRTPLISSVNNATMKPEALAFRKTLLTITFMF